MSKILIFSDIHIHPHKQSSERLQDCISALIWVFETAIKEGVNHLVFAGDLFHDRKKIDILTYQRTFEVIQKYVSEDGINIDFLLGNHDLWHFQKWDVSSVFPLAAIKGVRVIDRPCTISIYNQDVSFLPYTHDPITDITRIKNKSKFKLLFGHCAIDGAILNSAGTEAEVNVEHDGDMVKVSPEIFKDWDQVFLGHYHAEQKIGTNAEYVGSPLELSFGECFQRKHVIIYDLETHEKKYIENKFSPKHLKIRAKDVKNHDLDKNFVRIMVDDLTQSNIIDMKAELLETSSPGSLEIVERKSELKDNLIEDATAILYKEDEMLETYVDALETNDLLGDLDKKKLIEIGKFIIESEIDE